MQPHRDKFNTRSQRKYVQKNSYADNVLGLPCASRNSKDSSNVVFPPGRTRVLWRIFFAGNSTRWNWTCEAPPLSSFGRSRPAPTFNVSRPVFRFLDAGSKRNDSWTLPHCVTSRLLAAGDCVAAVSSSGGEVVTSDCSGCASAGSAAGSSSSIWQRASATNVQSFQVQKLSDAAFENANVLTAARCGRMSSLLTNW